MVPDFQVTHNSNGTVAPFASDELAVMAKAWAPSGFSMRKLQKIVAATLEARDACQMRH